MWKKERGSGRARIIELLNIKTLNFTTALLCTIAQTLLALPGDEIIVEEPPAPIEAPLCKNKERLLVISYSCNYQLTTAILNHHYDNNVIFSFIM